MSDRMDSERLSLRHIVQRLLVWLSVLWVVHRIWTIETEDLCGS